MLPAYGASIEARRGRVDRHQRRATARRRSWPRSRPSATPADLVDARARDADPGRARRRARARAACPRRRSISCASPASGSRRVLCDGARPRRRTSPARAELEALAREHRRCRVVDGRPTWSTSAALRHAGAARRRGALPLQRRRRRSAPSSTATASTSRAHGARAGRRSRRRPTCCVRAALAVPHRRRLRLASAAIAASSSTQALRAHRARRAGRARLPAPGGARHRPREQDPRLRAAGPAAATRSRRTSSSASSEDLRDYGIGAQILRDLGVAARPAAHQQPAEDRRPRGVRHRASSTRVPLEVPPHARQHRLSPHQAGEARASAVRASSAELIATRCRASSQADPNGDGLRIGIALARFNRAVTDRAARGRARGARGARRRRRRRSTWRTCRAPSSCRSARSGWRVTGRYDALVCLGAVVRGETPHFDYVARRGGARASADVARQLRPAGGVRRPHHRHDGAGARARRRRGTATRATRPR